MPGDAAHVAISVEIVDVPRHSPESAAEEGLFTVGDGLRLDDPRQGAIGRLIAGLRNPFRIHRTGCLFDGGAGINWTMADVKKTGRWP